MKLTGNNQHPTDDLITFWRSRSQQTVVKASMSALWHRSTSSSDKMDSVGVT